MGDDLHYVGGDNYILDDLTGFKIRRSKSRIIPGGQTGGLAVGRSRWEPQQPQDFVKGVPDDQTVPLSRPRQVNQFILIGTQVAAFAPAGSTVVTVQGTVGFNLGARCQIVLDNGNIFYFSITALTATTITFAGQPLPWAVGGTFADPLENAIIQIGVGGRVGGALFILGTLGHDVLGGNVLGP